MLLLRLQQSDFLTSGSNCGYQNFTLWWGGCHITAKSSGSSVISTEHPPAQSQAFSGMKPELTPYTKTTVELKPINNSGLTPLDSYAQVQIFYLVSAIFISLWLSPEVNYLLTNMLHIHMYVNVNTYQKWHLYFWKASKDSHNSGQSNISVWTHPISSKGQHSYNTLGCFFHQLERKEPMNNIKQARPHHLIYSFLRLTLEVPGAL